MSQNHKILGEKRVVQVGDLAFGGDRAIWIAGPCSVESREQLLETASLLKGHGAHMLRGGVFKPRTSPYAFQGIGLVGLEYMKEASEKFGMPVVTEVMDDSHLEAVCSYCDVLQVGSRNMYNYELLKKLGKIDKPVLLKRGMSATIHEWIMAAEYLAAYGNPNIILCERGIRTFDDYTRNTLDLSAVPIMQMETGLPIIVDPSHGTGLRKLIAPMSRAAIGAGADGLMIEVHIRPEEALSDGHQSLTPDEFGELKRSLDPFHFEHP